MRRIRRSTIVVTALLGAVACIGIAAVKAAAPRIVVDPASVQSPRTPSSPGDGTASNDALLDERWRVALPVDVVGLPAVDSGGIVVTAGESEVVALDNRGVIEWTAEVAGALVNAPRLDSDLVFVAAKRAVVALRRDSGAVVWIVATNGDAAEDNRANRPVVAGDVVVASTASGRVFGLERATGSMRWTLDMATAITSEPAADSGVAVVVGIGQWWALDPATGAMVWSADLGTFGTSSPVVYDDGGRVLAAVASDGEVLAVDARNGEVAWRCAGEQSELFQVPVITAAHELLVPDHWGRLAAFDAHDGRVLWRVKGADGVAEFGSPAPLGGRRVALSLDDGGPRIASPDDARAVRPPAAGHGVATLSDGALVVTTWGPSPNYVLAYDVGRPNR